MRACHSTHLPLWILGLELRLSGFFSASVCPLEVIPSVHSGSLLGGVPSAAAIEILSFQSLQAQSQPPLLLLDSVGRATPALWAAGFVPLAIPYFTSKPMGLISSHILPVWDY